MFTIQYTGVDGQSHMQVLDSRSRSRLCSYLSQFPHPILALYEQSTVITKAIRKDMADWPGSKTRAAADFINSPG